MDNNINCVAVLLIILVVLPLSVRVAPGRPGLKKRAQSLCVGGSWHRVGSFRIWRRAACGKQRQTSLKTPHGGPGLHGRRQADNNSDGKTTKRPPSTLNIEEILPSEEAGPERNENYNPNYGYEPYWVGGDWVFDVDPYKKDSALYMCNIRCPQVYTEYGQVCGRNKDFEYKTFDNYCQLRNEDCSNVARWMVLYKGTCYRQLKPLDRYDPINYAISDISKFMISYPDYNTKAVGFCTDCPEVYLGQKG